MKDPGAGQAERVTSQETPREPYLEGLNQPGADGAVPATTEPAAAPVIVVRPKASARIWVVAVLTAIVLVALIVFIAQNTASTQISFFGFSGSLPLAAALLAAALAGASVTAAVGAARSMVRRRAARRSLS